jgi:hypothetical protein
VGGAGGVDNALKGVSLSGDGGEGCRRRDRASITERLDRSGAEAECRGEIPDSPLLER